MTLLNIRMKTRLVLKHSLRYTSISEILIMKFSNVDNLLLIR